MCRFFILFILIALRVYNAYAAESPLAQALSTKAAEVKKLLADDLRMIVREPFIIAGNLSEKNLATWHQQTIQPAAAALGRQYFTTPPNAPIVIWLFTDADTYTRHAERIYGDKDISVYGYYKPDQRALVMNIGTGGGTLIHELAHALAAVDFPGQPDWFNEGLASLYEQSRFAGTGEKLRIYGLTNWRLPKLQEAIKAGKLQSLTELMSLRDFRGANMGLNYAQARYFCQYLQEQGKLEEYYRAFRDNREEDPHGLKAAKKVLGAEAWQIIDADYQKWVLGLRPIKN
ncbi:MAG: hypothetical protein SFX18_01035 [Pirellulales bacterium]|nr:hypothetical protein [Pirellulales bacterium]